MKKLVILICLYISYLSGFSQITTGKTIDLGSLKREDYTIIENVSGKAHSSRVWILFIPFGPKSMERTHQKAYANALKECNCDGIINPIYEDSKIPITLIVTTYTYRKTKVSGRGFKIKAG